MAQAVIRVVISVAGAVLFGPITAAQDTATLPPSSSQTVDFKTHIEPILRSRCFGCHGAAQQISGLRLDQKDAAMRGGYSGPVIQPGKSADSKLVHRVAALKGVMAMPPSGDRLTPEEVGLVRAWIDQGAEWPAAATPSAAPAAKNTKSDHWAFQPIGKPKTPSVSNSAWVRNPVDAFILARLEREGIRPSPEAEKTTLLRRVSLDLTGLPPTPNEVAAFLADQSPDAYERVVDRLLSSPHFGERWARPWLDRARYADSDGYEKDWVRPWAWRYRHWVIQALNRDMPFDQFTMEQIAGDLLPDASVEQRVATGFHRQTLTNREGGIDNTQFHFEATVDRASTVSTTWLGLTAGCAQCHDHKFDPISQKDFYSLYAFFEDLEEVQIDAPLPGEVGPWLKSRDAYRAEREALLNEYGVAELQSAWEKRLLEASANPGKWTDWDLAWDCLLKLTEGGDGEKILRIPEHARTERQRGILVDHFIRNYHFAVGPKEYERVKFKELDGKLTALKTKYPQLSQAMVVEEQPSDKPHFLRVRGDYRALGIPVVAETPAVLPPMNLKAKREATRLDLARWVVSPENPLTARVAVNFVWQELFGQGLVRTSDDFGTRSEPPGHPELLDWLASEFRDTSRWSMKALIRTVVTSATYRQSSKVREELLSRDPNNTLLARQSRLRLPAELLRDAALHAGSILALGRVGGKSVFPPQPAGVVELGYGKRGEAAWPESEGLNKYRRGLYIHFQRTTPYPLMVNFDAPKGTVAQCRRDRSNTALQALNLLNDPVFVEAAAALAFQSVTEGGRSFEAALSEAFLRAVGRNPTQSEQTKIRQAWQRQQQQFETDTAAAAQLTPSCPPNMSRAEFAAWVWTASALLNTDEFMTRE